ncbi:Clampless protein 1 [Grifola frondosa]|uniref:Clampless protein 1 n=1 Tax=Grifola frondosa TaxID=5627 RepID=A0A1C7MJ13_GRIFR|nr:Clampless protein 1 [Grifola frondosa]
MFQVASRPVAPHLVNIPTTLILNMAQQPVYEPPRLNLPRRLARPTFSEPSRETIARIDPELENVPPEYIRKSLAGQANQMLTALSLLTLPESLPCVNLPPSIDAPVRPSMIMPDSSAFPTHMLAILSSRFPPTLHNRPAVPLLRARSRNALHTSTPTPRVHSSSRRATLSLPIVPLTVPSPETFPLLHAYLHTKRADTLLLSLFPALGSMLPALPASSSSSPRQRSYLSQFSSERLLGLAHALVDAVAGGRGRRDALAVLMAHVKFINGLWQNVCALGVFDPELWGVLDLAWEIVLVALTRAAEGGQA